MSLSYNAHGVRTVQVNITRGRTKFYLTASWAPSDHDIFIQHLSNGDSTESPWSLVSRYCMPMMQSIAPETSVRNLTIEDFLHAPTYHLEIVPLGTYHNGICVVGQDRCSEETAYHLLPAADGPVAYETIPHFSASKIKLAPFREDLDNLGSLGGQVVTEVGEILHFKPREEGREKEFDRELKILLQLRGQKDLRVSKLRGLVVSERHEKRIIIGLLIALITPNVLGMQPLENGFCGRFELHEMWEKQVTATVQELHNLGIVWGDVNPCNIIIDQDLNAWVIDFGGNFNWEFVDQDNAETMRGDWQGLDRLFRDWLPNRRIWPSGEIL